MSSRAAATTHRRAFRFALSPNDRQKGRLASHAGGARFAYNLGLQWLKESLEKRRLGSDVSTPNATEMHRRWNRWKKDPANSASWWADNSKCVYQEAFRDLELGFRSFLASKNGKRKGPRVHFPRFKCKGRCRDGFRLTGLIRVWDHAIQLPKLGRIRLHELSTTLVVELDAGTTRITSASVNREADRWFVTFRVERVTVAPKRPTGKPIGVDFGISTLATLSNGVVFAGPRSLLINLRKLRRLSRGHARKHSGSANRRRSARKLARCHARVSHLRRDHLHKLSTYLAKNHSRIVIEDLNVKAMLKHRRLARSIADAGWGVLAEMLAYKCRWYGSELVRADRFFASSKTCSRCGVIKRLLNLSDREFVCDGCGETIDRDLNAARNLARWPGVAGSASETQNACGGNIRPGGSQAGPDEAGTEQPALASGSEPNAGSVGLQTGRRARKEGRVASGI